MLIAKICENCGIAFTARLERTRFCSISCAALFQNRTNPKISLPREDIYVVRVLPRLITTKNGCHEWTGARNDRGYGQTSLGKKRLYVHRIAWEYTNGRMLKKGECVLHSCDNPPCANPEHLFVGSHLDNMRDAVKKDRVAYGERKPRMTKLKQVEVEEIRQRYANGGVLQRELAREFGVSPGAISHVVRGDTWSRAPGPISGYV